MNVRTLPFAFISWLEFVAGLAVQQNQLGASDARHVVGHEELGHPNRHRPSIFSPLQLGGSHALTGFVALGDSYNAGIGTGVDGPEDDCRHGLHAYAQLIANDLAASQGGPSTTSFQFLSCTGAQTEEILSGGEVSQIDSLNASQPIDFALLSVGGNDLGFFDAINACVFRFHSFYSGNCETALERSRAQLEGEDFENRLQILIMEVLDKVRWEKKPWFFVTMTGYARFFNEFTDACDDMSFGVWWHGPKLKKELRLRMNALVLAVNAKVRKAVDMVNSQFTRDKVLFVDYDDAFDGHRFCEEDVAEPDYGRKDTWFFLVGGPDNARDGTQPTKQTDVATLSPSSALVDPSSCLEPAQRSGDWGELALCYMALAKQRDPTLRPARGDIVAQDGMWYTPTYYAKTFHPRSLGHEVVRDKIYEAWHQREAEWSARRSSGSGWLTWAYMVFGELIQPLTTILDALVTLA